MKLYEVLDDDSGEERKVVDPATFAKHVKEEKAILERKRDIINARLDYFLKQGDDLEKEAEVARLPIVRAAKQLINRQHEAPLEYIRRNCVQLTLPPPMYTDHYMANRKVLVPNTEPDLIEQIKSLYNKFSTARDQYEDVQKEISRLNSFGWMFQEALNLTPTRTTKQSGREMMHNIKLKPLGEPGAFGAAYNLPGAVERALKIGTTDPDHKPERDGYLMWLKMIHDHPNPFFPQIDQLKTFKREDNRLNRTHYHVKMEKLLTDDKLNKREAQHLLRQYFNLETTPEIEHTIAKQAIKWQSTEAEEYIGLFTAILRALITGDTTPYPIHIENKQLLEALKMLQQMHRQGFSLDLHRKNVLFRRTPYGIQPVFTDPFSNKYM